MPDLLLTTFGHTHGVYNLMDLSKSISTVDTSGQPRLQEHQTQNGWQLPARVMTGCNQEALNGPMRPDNLTTAAAFSAACASQSDMMWPTDSLFVHKRTISTYKGAQGAGCALALVVKSFIMCHEAAAQ